MIIVTGGTHGIGRACVELLAQNGNQVLFTGRDQEAGNFIEHHHRGTKYFKGDIAVEDDCRCAVDAALELGNGLITGLVNNAGISSRMAFLDSSIADWDHIMNTNARSVYLFTRFALQGLIAAKGAVVNVASIAGKVGEEGLSIYCASKAALIGLTQALALEYGATVRFNAVCPGQIDTRMTSRMSADSEMRRLLELRIPAGRLGTANEVAQTIAWLLSPQSGYINGAVLTIDGGETAGIRALR